MFANLADENFLIIFAFLTLVPLHHLICLRDYFTESKTIKQFVLTLSDGEGSCTTQMG